MTKDEVLATLQLTGDERFTEAVKAFSAAGLLKNVKMGTVKCIILTDDTELSPEDL